MIEILNETLKIETSKLKYFLEEVKVDDKRLYNEDVKAMSLFKEKIIQLLNRNILFLNPIKGTLIPQSFLVWNAIKRVLF
ncbi:protein of unknown function [Methanocaldococcus lauensis]|nr:protein of unknown function [Methanocaldococcus lauensis]